MFLHVRGLHGFGDFEEGFMVEWGKKLVIGTNYFTDPMGNVLNFEFEDDLIKKGIFRIPYHFEEFYELEDLHYICTLLCDPMGNVLNFEFEDDLIKKGIFRIPYHFEEFYELEDLHYICTLLCGDRYFRIRIFDTYWTEIEYPGFVNKNKDSEIKYNNIHFSFKVFIVNTMHPLGNATMECFYQRRNKKASKLGSFNDYVTSVRPRRGPRNEGAKKKPPTTRTKPDDPNGPDELERSNDPNGSNDLDGPYNENGPDDLGRPNDQNGPDDPDGPYDPDDPDGPNDPKSPDDLDEPYDKNRPNDSDRPDDTNDCVHVVGPVWIIGPVRVVDCVPFVGPIEYIGPVQVIGFVWIIRPVQVVGPV
ncbi:hypothetical protein DEO72_LG9g2107 [Vigna unguiculata]|uniref:Uncharacterized protein n=1 Tax=Vigna unguiculata TaxID=3917 RepID=A0A4D6N2L0_VIGUN|nr:hypothetical protein DEO72_LG9g2107 [Vigna unguiculata]